MSCTRSGFILIVYILDLLVGLLALFLPFWVSGKFEAARNVTVVKETDSGLFKDHSVYYLKDDTLPDDSENVFPDISGTYIDLKVVSTVKALMITGLSLLTLALLIHSIYRCCCHDDETKGKTSAIVYAVMSIITIFSGGFIVSCPLTFRDHVIKDFDPDIIHFGASWWLAVIAAALTFLLGLLTAIFALNTLCETISENSEQSKPRSKKEEVFSRY